MGKWHVPCSADGKPCKKCKKTHVSGKPDPCMSGYIPNVAHACCGHGVTKDAMVNGFPGCNPHDSITDWDTMEIKKGYWVLKGKEALDYMGLEE